MRWWYLHNTTNGKSVISDKSGGLEGPNNTEVFFKIPFAECNKKWASLFGSKLKGKAISPVLHKVDLESGACSISIIDYIVDHNMSYMNLVLVGKFVGRHPNIKAIRAWVSRKWKGKGQIDVEAMAGGFFSFSFAYEEDIRSILVGGP